MAARREPGLTGPRGARYAEHAPHAALRDRVQCYWTVRGSVPERRAGSEAVVPDACMDFIFDLAGSTALVVGTMTRPLRVRRAGWVDLLGVRFQPGAIGAVVDLPASTLTDGLAPLSDVAGRRAGALLASLEGAGATDERTAVLDRALLRLTEGRPRGDAPVMGAARVLASRGGAVSIAELAGAVGLSRRQLERRFLRAVGIPPKTAGRVIRFQAALARMLARPADPLAAVALRSGYHDQAHFTRDFAALAGEPPGAYRARRTAEEGDAFLQDSDPGLA